MALSPQFGSLIPSQTQQLLQQNYLTFDGAAGGNSGGSGGDATGGAFCSVITVNCSGS